MIQFAPVSGWNVPTNQSVGLNPGAITVVNANYTVTSPVTMASGARGIGLSGTPGTSYLIQYRTNLISGTWFPLQTNTLGAGVNYVLPWPPTSGAAAFYRAVWLP